MCRKMCKFPFFSAIEIRLKIKKLFDLSLVHAGISSFVHGQNYLQVEKSDEKLYTLCDKEDTVYSMRE